MTENSRTQPPLKIDIVVHGRFHAFHLARALITRGHDVRILTNYPGWATRRFGLPKSAVHSFVTHGILSRAQDHLLGRRTITLGQPTLHRIFGLWAAGRVRSDCDLVYIFSGVAEETLRRFAGKARPRIWLTRGSSHIRTQLDLLETEEHRAGVSLDKPSRWSTDREEREYALSNHIVTLSTFSLTSFKDHGRLSDKSFLLLSAVDVTRFQQPPSVLEERLRRIQMGERLRVLTVGAFSFRKGAVDLVRVARTLAGRVQFRFVGDMPLETTKLRLDNQDAIEFVKRVPEFELSQHYRWADLFLFPTIEDGFPAVVAQAQASGLPVITTPNGSGPDLVRDGEDGWIVPIRNPEAIVAILDACDRNRLTLAKIVRANAVTRSSRDWAAMAADLETELARQSSL